MQHTSLAAGLNCILSLVAGLNCIVQHTSLAAKILHLMGDSRKRIKFKICVADDPNLQSVTKVYKSIEESFFIVWFI